VGGPRGGSPRLARAPGEDRIISFNGEPFHPLAALSPVQEAFDAAALSLELVLPPALFDATALQPGRVTTIEPRAARGGFVDYDVLYLAGDRVRSRLNELFELGVFDPIGVLIGSFRTGNLVGDGREIVRLDTTFIKDMPPRRATLRFGDSLIAGGTLGRPVRFGGIQLASNFATDPSFIAFPLPRIGGLAAQPSTAELFLDNTRRVVEQVPPGPFEIDNLPVSPAAASCSCASPTCSAASSSSPSPTT
jgi:outer membrane usher protein